MGREILVDGSTLDYCAVTLSSLSASLEDLAGVLGGISAQSAGIVYRVRSAAPTLSGLIASSPHHGDVQSAIASYAGTLRAFGHYSSRLSSGVRGSAKTFEECERQLAYRSLHQAAVRAVLTASGAGGAVTLADGSPLVGLAELLGIDSLSDLSALMSGQTISQGILDATSASGSFQAGGEWLSYHTDTVDASVGYVNVNASGSAGVFQRDSDGNLIFSPYATGGVALGFGLLSATWSDSIGNEMLGAHGSTSVEVLTGSVNANGTIAMIDAKGNFNPTASVNASVEFTVASASAKGGITVAGVDMTASAEASVGLGAHMNVGYEDGVISMDIGAAIGIGGSVSVSVDLGGVVNAVTGTAESLFNGLFH